MFVNDIYKSSLEIDLIPNFVKQHIIEGITLEDNQYFTDIGVPEALRDTRNELISQLARPAVFFDRDNTLIVDGGYTHKIKDFQWVKGAVQTIREFNKKGFFVFIVTNQAGVAHGMFCEKDVCNFHEYMRTEAVKNDCNIDGILYCPHHPDGQNEKYRLFCASRKPDSGMIEKFIKHWLRYLILY